MKTVVKGLSFLGVGIDANCVQVDVEDGKILRIRPFHFDWKYDREALDIEARGQIFTASGKTLIPPFTLGYKNRVFSPNRVKYPLKRVDWDPSGAPAPPARAGATPRTGAPAATSASPGTRRPRSSPPRSGG